MSETTRAHWSGTVSSLSPDGQTLASGSNDFSVRLWDITGNVSKMQEHTSQVWTVAFSPEGDP